REIMQRFSTFFKNDPDPLVREAYLMAFDYINYVMAKPGIPVNPAPSRATASLRHAGDELLIRFPIFFQLAWSAVLSVFVLSGQLVLHCQESGMSDIPPRIQECVGSYVERVICPEIRDRGGWVSVKGQRRSLLAKPQDSFGSILNHYNDSLLLYFFCET
uniref:Bcl-2 Bcl-2 homology region 1-3 domain-containing protein n=1 Tax=Sinocyclocheilus grahami TaxID=75366 RepID=A0A672SJE2_SINGR